MTNIKQLQDIASIIRRDSIELSNKNNSPYLKSCLSSAEILSALFFSEMQYDIKNQNNPDNDELVISNPETYFSYLSTLFHSGCIRDLSEDSWTKTNINSKGEGLSIALGFSLASKLKKKKSKTYVLMDESELLEGKVWEAIQFAHSSNIHICTIIETSLQNSKSLKQKIDSFGWNSHIINGNEIKQLLNAFKESRKSEKPFAIIAHTIKGKGVSFIENNQVANQILNDSTAMQALKEINYVKMPRIAIKRPKKISAKENKNSISLALTNYKVTELISTYDAYKNILSKLVQVNDNITPLNSLSEQNKIGLAIGLSLKGLHPFIFSSDLSKAHNQLLQYSSSKLKINISSISNKEDIPLSRLIPFSSVFYPSDALSTEKIVKMSESLPGITYIALTDFSLPILYKTNEEFPLGEFKTLISSANDKVVLACSGTTIQETLKAHTQLKSSRIDSSVIDLYSIKPLDSQKLIEFVKEHGNTLLVVEENIKEGGIGEMISRELSNSGIKLAFISLGNEMIDSNLISSTAKSALEEPKPLEEIMKEETSRKKNKIKTKKKKR